MPGKNNVQPQLNEETQVSILRLATKLDPVWAQRLAQPSPTDCEPERTMLAKHLAVYTAKNSFDYFIHKDLRGFLRRELDLYLKTEIMALDDFDPDSVESESRLSRVLVLMSAVRSLGGKVIDFLAQLEDFHKSIWLKKKFVLETNYGITLDKVPESFYAEIAANEAQIAEWVQLYALDEVAGFAKPLSVSFLNDCSHIIVDTRHFGRDFVDRLLTALADCETSIALEADLDGLLVQGENFQAMSLLQKRYQGGVDCVYIDPPYNTDASAILYKNNYKNSSWLSLISDRLILARNCLSSHGILCVAIDDEEVAPLRFLGQQLFPRELGIVPVRSNPAGRKSRGQFSPSHEYALFYGNAKAVPGTLDKTERELSRYPRIDRDGQRYAWNNLIRHGSGDRRADRPTMYYPIYVGNDDTLRVPRMAWNDGKQAYDVFEQPTGEETVLWPTRVQDGVLVEKRWHQGPDRVRAMPSDYRVRRTIDEKSEEEEIHVDFKIRMDVDSMPKTWWEEKKYASANLGPKVLKELFGEKKFDFPKAVGLVEDCLRASLSSSRSVVLDFFAGSGTTGQAIISLNRADGGRRRFILVEIGSHFDAVLLPRIKKVTYSHDWKDGKPVSRDGQSHFFKYIRLESHEDALDSLEVKPLEDANDLFAVNPELAEDYALRYQLKNETAASATLCGGDFARPGGYTLSVVRDGARRDVAVDLSETFNYLIGLRIHARRVIEDVLAITGIDADETRCLVLWRDIETTGNDALNAWFETHGERIRAEFNASLVYVNGDHELGRLTPSSGAWTTSALELVFREKMFAAEVE